MKTIDYSVIIRTTGKAGEKYQALLDSINILKPRPIEVIVVLPEGFNAPKEQLGYERILYCPKGMVVQRMTGIKHCKTRYALICDDDIRFDSDFVQKLYAPIKEGLCGLSAGPLYSFLPQRGTHLWADLIMARAVPMFFHRNQRYVSVLKSAGYSYNRHLQPIPQRYYEAQSVAWTCFFADLNTLNDIELQDEKWLDANGYSAMDDQTMFYKAWLRGYKTIIVSDASYEHLDGKTSTRGNSPSVMYATPFNLVVFWHRFIFKLQPTIVERLLSVCAFAYRLMWNRVWDLYTLARKKMSLSDFLIQSKGYKDAWKYISSDEYKNLPAVIKEHR